MAAKNYPRIGSVYTYAQVCELDLQDSPFLMIRHEENYWPIQTSHVGYVNDKCGLLSIPSFADTQWEYIRTTSEWIPIFYYAGDESIVKQLLTIEVDDGDPDSLLVAPKMFPFEQNFD